MIQKLKTRLTLITMSMVTIVLLLVFAGLCISEYTNSRDETLAALELALYGDSMKPDQTGNPPDKPDQQPQDTSDSGSGSDSGSSQDSDPSSQDNTGLYDIGHDGSKTHGKGTFTPTIVARYDADGTITLIRSNMATITDETLSEMVSAVMENATSDSQSGRLPSYSVRYETKTEDDGSTTIAFADSSQERSSLLSLLRSSLAVGIPALVVLYLISSWLSSQAVKPVKTSMDQQKQFVADASHELKTPLSVIMANNEIMMTHTDETVAEQKKWLESTHEEASRMQKLIENLLFLAKSDAGRMQPALLNQNLSDLVEECALTFEPVAFEQGILIDSQVEPDIMASVDAAQMKQLTLILLDNAVKYSVPKGTVSICLKKEGTGAQLSVNNKGDVISPEVIPHLFERFYRTDEARSHSQAGGYGLGLAIARTITDLHHGKISCTSTAGEGTTFTAWIPLTQHENTSSRRHRRLGKKSSGQEK